MVVLKGRDEVTKYFRAFISGVRKQLEGKGLEDDEDVMEVILEMLGRFMVLIFRDIVYPMVVSRSIY